MAERNVFEEIDRQFSLSKTGVAVTLDSRPSNRQISIEIKRKISEEKERIKERRTIRRAREGFEKEKTVKRIKTIKKIGSILLSTGPSLKPRSFKQSGPLSPNIPNLFGKQSNPFSKKTKNPFVEE